MNVTSVLPTTQTGRTFWRLAGPVTAPAARTAGRCHGAPNSSFLKAGWSLLIAVLVLGLSGPLAFADDPPEQDVRVEAHVDRTEITVGDRIRLTVVAHAAPGIQLGSPEDDGTLGTFEVIERRIGALQGTPDGGTLLRADYLVTAFELGTIQLPGLSVPFTDARGNQQMSLGPELQILVRSVLENDPNPQLLDLKPPRTIPGGASDTMRSIAAGVLVAAALGITVLMLRRRPRHARMAIPVPFEVPQEAARRELAAIVSDGLLDREDYETFYRRLALCIRRYLEDGYGLPALSSTSTELGRAMAARGTDRWLARVVTGLLDECDTVRWAGYQPADERAKRALDLAFAIVEMETRVPVGAS